MLIEVLLKLTVWSFMILAYVPKVGPATEGCSGQVCHKSVYKTIASARRYS